MAEFQRQFLVNLAVTFVVVTCLLGTHAQPPSPTSAVSGPTTTKPKCSMNSIVGFTNVSNMTSEQKNNSVTIEFKLTGGKKGDDLSMEHYCAIRQAILKELNKRHRNRPKFTTSIGIPSTTTESSTTVAPTTTPSTTTASTTTAMTTEAPTTAPSTVTTEEIIPTVIHNKRKRKRRDSDDEDEPDFYTEDDLNFVLVEPLVVDGVARMSLFLSKDESSTTVAPTTTPSTTTASTTTAMTTEAPTTAPSTVTTEEIIPTVIHNKRKRKRRDSDDEDEPDFYTEDDLNFVLVEPLVVDGVARMSLFLSKDGVEIDPYLLYNATDTLNGEGTLEREADMPVKEFYKGLPPEALTTSALVAAAGLDFRFLLALLLIIICFIVILVAIVCVRRQRSEPEHEQLIEVPGSFSPVNGQPNDAHCVPNGTRHVPDDDGYIVPYHEMLAARRDKLSVEAYPEQSRL